MRRPALTRKLGIEIAFDPHRAQGLDDATPAKLVDVEITPAGLGLYFPRRDAGFSIPASKDGVFGKRKWMAAQLRVNWHVPLDAAAAAACAGDELRGGLGVRAEGRGVGWTRAQCLASERPFLSDVRAAGE